MTGELTGEKVTDNTVTLTQTQVGWQNNENKTGLTNAGMTLTNDPVKDGAGGKATLTYDSKTGKISVTFNE